MVKYIGYGLVIFLFMWLILYISSKRDNKIMQIYDNCFVEYQKQNSLPYIDYMKMCSR